MVIFDTNVVYTELFFPPIWEHDLCVSVWSLCFFMSGFCYLAMYSIYITTESHVHLRGNLSDPVWAYSHTCVAVQVELHHGENKVSLQNQPVKSRLAHTHNPLGLIVYMWVFYTTWALWKLSSRSRRAALLPEAEQCLQNKDMSWNALTLSYQMFTGPNIEEGPPPHHITHLHPDRLLELCRANTPDTVP